MGGNPVASCQRCGKREFGHGKAAANVLTPDLQPLDRRRRSPVPWQPGLLPRRWTMLIQSWLNRASPRHSQPFPCSSIVISRTAVSTRSDSSAIEGYDSTSTPYELLSVAQGAPQVGQRQGQGIEHCGPALSVADTCIGKRDIPVREPSSSAREEVGVCTSSRRTPSRYPPWAWRDESCGMSTRRLSSSIAAQVCSFPFPHLSRTLQHASSRRYSLPTSYNPRRSVGRIIASAKRI